jgi:hypothetical protein
MNPDGDKKKVALPKRFETFLTDRPTDRPADRPTDRLTDRLTGWLTGWQAD